jgi:hypothetical protein
MGNNFGVYNGLFLRIHQTAGYEIPPAVSIAPAVLGGSGRGQQKEGQKADNPR